MAQRSAAGVAGRMRAIGIGRSRWIDSCSRGNDGVIWTVWIIGGSNDLTHWSPVQSIQTLGAHRNSHKQTSG